MLVSLDIWKINSFHLSAIRSNALSQFCFWQMSLKMQFKQFKISQDFNIKTNRKESQFSLERIRCYLASWHRLLPRLSCCFLRLNPDDLAVAALRGSGPTLIALNRKSEVGEVMNCRTHKTLQHLIKAKRRKQQQNSTRSYSLPITELRQNRQQLLWERHLQGELVVL